MSTSRLLQSTAFAVAAALALAGCKPAQPAGTAGAIATPASGATLTVQAQPDLGAQYQAMPRFTGGDATATARINAAMAKLDAASKEGLSSCPEMPHNGQSQDVAVTRNGALLAIEVSYESDCGAYPSSGTNAYTFDTATGALVDWSRLLPGAAIKNSDPDPDYFTNYFTSAPLQARIIAAANKETDAQWKADCLPVLSGADASLTARINAETGTLDVTPDLVHAVQACANTLSLTSADLTALNADPRLIAAVKK